MPDAWPAIQFLSWPAILVTFALAGSAFAAAFIADRRNSLARRLHEVGEADATGSRQPHPWDSIDRFAGRILPLERRVLGVRARPELLRVAAVAKISPRAALAVLIAVQTIAGLVAGAAAYLVGARLAPHLPGPQMAAIVVLASLAGAYLPDYALRRGAQKRSRSIEEGLPDALELLVVCTEAGLALETAVDRVAKELRPSQPALADELATTSADLRILPDRDLALRALADRVGLDSVRSVVTTLSQTMRYGTPLSQALRVTAAELRNDALIRLEERAGQLPVLMTIPMIIFLLPCIILLVGGPAYLQVMDSFSR